MGKVVRICCCVSVLMILLIIVRPCELYATAIYAVRVVAIVAGNATGIIFLVAAFFVASKDGLTEGKGVATSTFLFFFGGRLSTNILSTLGFGISRALC